MEVGTSHVIRAAWHPKLNQMMVGSGDGIVRVYYDPERSVRGAKLCMVKKRTEAKQVKSINSLLHGFKSYSFLLYVKTSY